MMSFTLTHNVKRRYNTPQDPQTVCTVIYQVSNGGNLASQETQVYSHPECQHFRFFDNDEILDADGALLIVVQGQAKCVVDYLRNHINFSSEPSRRFPWYFTEQLEQSTEPRSPILLRHKPDGQKALSNLYATMSYRGNDGHPRGYRISGVLESRTPHEKAKIHTRVAVWVGHSVMLQNSPKPRSVVVLAFADQNKRCSPIIDLPKCLLAYYQFINPSSGTPDLHQFKRLGAFPVNIFYDLDILFSNWDNIANRYLRLARLHENSHQPQPMSALQQARSLYQGMTELPMVKADVSFHCVVNKKLKSFIDELLDDSKNDRGNFQSIKEEILRFRDRLENLNDNLHGDIAKLDMLTERFRTLLDLEFNVSTAKTEINMTHLTYIMFLFTPIAFVSAVWGMTEFHIQPIFFLPLAITVFVISALFLLYSRFTVNNVNQNFAMAVRQNRLAETPYYEEAAGRR